MGDLFILTVLKIDECCHKDNLTAVIRILCEDSCDEVETLFFPTLQRQHRGVLEKYTCLEAYIIY